MNGVLTDIGLVAASLSQLNSTLTGAFPDFGIVDEIANRIVVQSVQVIDCMFSIAREIRVFEDQIASLGVADTVDEQVITVNETLSGDLVS